MDAQLELGKLYLFGSAGLPKSLPTALHWLDRAARQDCAEACELIGMHIPLDVALQSTLALTAWYERAFDAGVVRAGVVMAQLMLGNQPAEVEAGRRNKALGALDAAMRAGQPEAQWLLTRYRAALPAASQGAAAAGAPAPRPLPSVPPMPMRQPRCLGGVLPTGQCSSLDGAWQACQWQSYLERALPLARQIVHAMSNGNKLTVRPSPEEVILLSRCARLASGTEGGAQVSLDELHRFWEIAAAENDRHAQMAVGLWYARMHVDGRRVTAATGSANFKKAIRWLTLAGEQGMAEAWYALSRIYIKPEFSQRNVADAQRYLERAAEMGYREAQLECGHSAWRARREHENNDVRAIFWLQKAAAQGCEQAREQLDRIAPRGQGPAYSWCTNLAVSRELTATYPLLAGRLELAALFGLSRAEALLLDIKTADQGHCLVIDIRASYGRSKRRLIAVGSAAERQVLDRISRLFDNVDCGPNGPEGNYRQRLYRLKTVLPDLAHADEHEVDALEMAA
ncbi:MAG: hypothetical protein ACLGI6_05945 [Gammaproteobacteria bacterium]